MLDAKMPFKVALWISNAFRVLGAVGSSIVAGLVWFEYSVPYPVIFFTLCFVCAWFAVIVFTHIYNSVGRNDGKASASAVAIGGTFYYCAFAAMLNWQTGYQATIKMPGLDPSYGDFWYLVASVSVVPAYLYSWALSTIASERSQTELQPEPELSQATK